MEIIAYSVYTDSHKRIITNSKDRPLLKLDIEFDHFVDIKDVLYQVGDDIFLDEMGTDIVSDYAENSTDILNSIDLGTFIDNRDIDEILDIILKENADHLIERISDEAIIARYREIVIDDIVNND